jgi:hypothetical protein
LQGESLVPTRVSNLRINLSFISDHFISERIFNTVSQIHIQFFLDVCS